MKKNLLKKVICLVICLCVSLCVLASCKSAEKLNAAKDEISVVVSGTDGKTELLSADQLEASLNGDSQKENPVKIIRTVKIHAQTLHFEDAVREIEGAVASLGGYVGSSQVQGTNLNQRNREVPPSRYANYTLRIPAERLDEFLSLTGEAVHIISTESNADDVTDEYYDVEARLAVLEAERTLLEKMLSESANVSTMISVEERLYDVIYEIESYESALRVYDHKVAYSTVNLTLSEVVSLTVGEKSFGTRVKEAVSESWNDLVEGSQDVLIALIYALPVLLILGAVVGGVCTVILVSIRRSRRRRREEKKASEEERVA